MQQHSSVRHERITFDNRLRYALADGLSAFEGELDTIRPGPKPTDLEDALEFLKMLHWERSTHRSTGPGPVHQSPYSFEIWLADNRTTITFATPSTHRWSQVRSELETVYPWSDVRKQNQLLPALDPATPLYIAGGTLGLAEPKYYPIRGIKSSDPLREDHDPFKQLNATLLANADERVIIQTTFAPADPDWVSGAWNEIPVSGYVKKHRQADIQERSLESTAPDSVKRTPPTTEDNRAVNYLGTLKPRNAWYVNTTYLVLAPTPTRAHQAADSIAHHFTATYANETLNQRFTTTPLTPTTAPSALWKLGARDCRGRDVVLTTSELGGLVHLPVDATDIDGLDTTHGDIGGTTPIQRRRKQAPPARPRPEVPPSAVVPPTPPVPDHCTLEAAAHTEHDLQGQTTPLSAYLPEPASTNHTTRRGGWLDAVRQKTTTCLKALRQPQPEDPASTSLLSRLLPSTRERFDPAATPAQHRLATILNEDDTNE